MNNDKVYDRKGAMHGRQVRMPENQRSGVV